MGWVWWEERNRGITIGPSTGQLGHRATRPFLSGAFHPPTPHLVVVVWCVRSFWVPEARARSRWVGASVDEPANARHIRPQRCYPQRCYPPLARHPHQTYPRKVTLLKASAAAPTNLLWSRAARLARYLGVNEIRWCRRRTERWASFHLRPLPG